MVGMKRDMDLVRCILITLSNSDERVRSDDPVFEGYSRQLVGYHFQILDEAGLIDAVVCGGDDDPYRSAFAYRLTWEGNDFLDSVRDEAIWKRVRSAVVEAAGGASLDVVKSIAPTLVAEAISGIL